MQIPDLPDVSSIPLVLALWQDTHFQGARRLLIYDVADLNQWNFNDKASAIGVHPGPSYEQWKRDHGGQEPTVSLYEDINFGGAVLTLTAGAYADIHARFAFGDKASSVRFNFESQQNAESTADSAAPIAPIKVVLQICTDINFNGRAALIVEDVPDVGAYLGGEYNDAASSIRVRQGPDHTAGDVGWLCIDANGKGGAFKFDPMLDEGNGPGNVADLRTKNLNDKGSSFFVVQDPNTI
jgi:hypothetical protein